MKQQNANQENFYSRGAFEVSLGGGLKRIDPEKDSSKSEKGGGILRKMELLRRELDRIETLAYAARNKDEAERIKKEENFEEKKIQIVNLEKEFEVLAGSGDIGAEDLKI